MTKPLTWKDVIFWLVLLAVAIVILICFWQKDEVAEAAIPEPNDMSIEELRQQEQELTVEIATLKLIMGNKLSSREQEILAESNEPIFMEYTYNGPNELKEDFVINEDYTFDPNAMPSITFSTDNGDAEFSIKNNIITCDVTLEKFLEILQDCLYYMIRDHSEPNGVAVIQWAGPNEPNDSYIFQRSDYIKDDIVEYDPLPNMIKFEANPGGIRICRICPPTENPESFLLSICPGHTLEEHLESLESRIKALEAMFDPNEWEFEYVGILASFDCENPTINYLGDELYCGTCKTFMKIEGEQE